MFPAPSLISRIYGGVVTYNGGDKHSARQRGDPEFENVFGGGQKNLSDVDEGRQKAVPGSKEHNSNLSLGYYSMQIPSVVLTMFKTT